MFFMDFSNFQIFHFLSPEAEGLDLDLQAAGLDLEAGGVDLQAQALDFEAQALAFFIFIFLINFYLFFKIKKLQEGLDLELKLQAWILKLPVWISKLKPWILKPKPWTFFFYLLFF